MTEPWDFTEAQRLQFREAQAAAKTRRRPRHPAEVTAGRLGNALEKWPDDFDGGDRDMVGQIIHILTTIAERGQQ